MIKAVVFDCFGVLTSDGWLPFKNKYFGHDSELLEQASDLSKQSDAGLISYHDFIEGIASLANLSVSETYHQIENNVADSELFAYIETLKPKYKIGMLSNAAENWLPEMFTPEQLGLFQAVSLSYETGYIKPQPQSYATIAERLGVDLAECVLIDDQERYCSGARDEGMQAIVFRNTQQAIADLTALLASNSN